MEIKIAKKNIISGQAAKFFNYAAFTFGKIHAFKESLFRETTTMKCNLIFLIIVLFPFCVNAQSDTIRLMTESRYVKSSDVSAITKMSLNGQEYNYSVTANMKTNYDVIRKNNSGYDLQITLDAINTELSSNGVKMSFDSQKDTLDNMDDSTFAKPLSDILGKSYHVAIGPFGEILRSDSSLLVQKAKEYITSTLLSGNDYSIGEKLDILFPFKDSVKVGTTWIDSVKIGDGLRVDTFTVDKIFNKNIYISSIGKISRSLPVQQGSKTIMAHFDGNTTSTIHVSEATGIISLRKMKTVIYSQINVNNIEIPISSEILLSEVVQ